MDHPSTPVVEPPLNPVMDVVPPATNSEPLASPPPEAAEPQPKQAGDSDAPAQPNRPKKVLAEQSGNRTTTAIVATVIIVLGLAAMATYAYLKQK